jgi:hypothetical protein
LALQDPPGSSTLPRGGVFTNRVNRGILSTGEENALGSYTMIGVEYGLYNAE